jgi:hypothetical protein
MRAWDDPVLCRDEGRVVAELRTVTLLGDDLGGCGATGDRRHANAFDSSARIKYAYPAKPSAAVAYDTH